MISKERFREVAWKVRLLQEERGVNSPYEIADALAEMERKEKQP